MSSTAPGITKRSNAYFIDPAMIDDDGQHNTRFELGDIGELAEQIRVVLEKDPASGGLLNDLRVKRKDDGRFQIVDGRRRFTAIQMLQKKGIQFPVGVPAKIVDKKQDDVTSIQQMFIANEGKDFLPLEEAACFKKLKDHGLTLKEIAKTVGRRETHVAEMLALIDATTELKEAVASGKIGKTTAKQIAAATKGDAETQKALTAQATAVGKDAKDKKKRRAVVQQIQQAKAAKAVKKGRKVPKMRALDDDQLAEMGEKVAKQLTVLMKEAPGDLKISELGNMLEWIKKDATLAVAATFGALQALKAAAGQKVDLEF